MDNKHRQPVSSGVWPSFHITANRLENGRTVVKVLSDDEKMDGILEAMGIATKFSISNQMDVAEINPAQAVELLQRYFGGAVDATPKRQLTDKQRAARAANAAKATAARKEKEQQ